MHDVTGSSDFATQLREAGERLVVVDFVANWCRNCKLLLPTVKELEQEYPDAVFLKVDTSVNEDLAVGLGVSQLPTVHLIRHNKKVAEFIGTKADKLVALVRQHAGASSAPAAPTPVAAAASLPQNGSDRPPSPQRKRARTNAHEQSAADAAVRSPQADAANAGGAGGAVAPRDATEARAVRAGEVHEILSRSDLHALHRAAGERALVVDVGAPWCRNCKVIAPQFAALARAAPHAVFASLDTTRCEELAMELGVSSLPAFVFFRAGERVGSAMGSKWEKVSEAIQRVIGPSPTTAAADAPAAAAPADAPAPAPASAQASEPLPKLSLVVPEVLNVPRFPGGYAVRTLPSSSAQAVAERLNASILALYAQFVSQSGDAVDYAGMKESLAFGQFVRGTEQLLDLDLAALDGRERTASVLNLYNALCIHGRVVLGSPSAAVPGALGRFFSSASYALASGVFSLDDLEHGILRGNKPHPTTHRTCFPPGDPRAALALPLDPRVHCALVCGAKSCPPIRIFRGADLDRALDLAARAFCDSQVSVDEGKATVTLSKIFLWYSADFGDTTRQQLLRIASMMSEGEARAALQRMVRACADDACGEVNVWYEDYDWSENGAST